MSTESRTGSLTRGSRQRDRPRKSTAKKKPKIEIEEEGWFEIKDIVEEKVEKGKLRYKVDWSSDKLTGREYSPSWIPAEDANEDAVGHWKRKKRRRAQTEPSTQHSSLDSQPVRPAQRRVSSKQNRKRGLSPDSEASKDQSSKRHRVGPEDNQYIASGYLNSDEIVQEVPLDAGQGEFRVYVELPLKPDFDPSEYTAIRSSQLSQYPTPESDSQRFVTASSSPPPVNNPFPRVHPQAVSQRTIPDSQDFSTDHSQGPLDATDLNASLKSAEDSQRTKIPAPKDGPNSHVEITGSSIQPRQLDGLTESSYGQKISFEFQSALDSDHLRSIPRQSGQSTSQPTGSSRQIQPGDEVPDFLTQPDFGAFELSAESGEHSQGLQNTAARDEEEHIQQSSHRVIDDFEQSAQVVRPLFSQPAEFRTQNQDDFSVTFDEHEIVPETSRKASQDHAPTGSQPTSQVTSLRTVPSSLRASNFTRHRQRTRLPDHVIESIEVDEESGEDRSRGSSSASSIDRVVSRNVTGTVRPATSRAGTPNMENTPPRRLSAYEKLKRAQAEAIGSSVEPSPADIAIATAIPPAQPSIQIPKVASPSAIMSSVEQEPFQESIPPVGQVPWMQQLTGHPLTPIHESASGTESAHLMDAIPASDINNQSGFQTDYPALGLDHEMIEGPQVEEIPATIAPSVLITSAESDVVLATSIPIGLEIEYNEDSDSEPVMSAPDFRAASDDELLSVASKKKLARDLSPQPGLTDDIVTETVAENEYLVTLPFPANVREKYFKTVYATRFAMEAFTKAVADCDTPDDSSTAKVDKMLLGLSIMCNLPTAFDSLGQRSADQTMRYARDASSKFSFIYELLHGLRDSPKTILIFTPPGQATEILVALLSATTFSRPSDDAPKPAPGYRFRYVTDSEWTNENSYSSLRIILARTDQQASPLPAPADVDIVIAFDQTARSAGMVSQYEAHGIINHKPHILSLVIAFSFEHIDRRLSGHLDPLERKNALLICLWNTCDSVQNLPEIMAPHEQAEKLGQYIADPESDLEWEAEEFNDDVFKVYLSSQSRATQTLTPQPEVDSTRSVSRKRQLDDSGLGVGMAKRPRVAETEGRAADSKPYEMSESLRELMGGKIINVKGDVAEVSVVDLESLATKVADLESRLKQKTTMEEKLYRNVNSLEEQVQGKEKTIKNLQPKYMQAIRDRGIFEKEQEQALKESNKLKSELNASAETVAKLKKDKELLMSDLAAAHEAMANSSNPDVAQLAQSAASLEEEHKKVAELTKRLANRQNDLDFSQKLYQDASSKAASLAVEIPDLKSQLISLQSKLSDHQTQARKLIASNEARDLTRLYEQEASIRRERERELGIVREELRELKKGRHGTRQASVPRSPRPSLMSPRAPRGASSRATSPAMPADFGRSHPHLSGF